MRLKGKTAIITGAASGMGASTAEIFASQGARVVLTDILETEGAEVTERICGAGGHAQFFVHDVTSESDWEKVVSGTVSAYGQVDILINNAGVSGSHPDLLNTETWDQQMSINARGVFLGMRAVIPLMQESGGGSIVNTSSISGVTGQSFVHMGYNAAKGAVRMATKAAAVQFAPDGIRVNSVHPGLMPAMRSSMMTADPAVREKMLSAVPAGRVGRVEEVAYANLFLACDESSYVTGVELPVDGGFLAM